MPDQFEIIGIITKKHPKSIIGEGNFDVLTKGFERETYLNSLKVLKENTVYSLNHNFNITLGDNNSFKVKEVEQPIDLYSFGSPKIQVNAIVGKNGSGKSTLSELIYLMLYNIAVDKQLIKSEDEKKIETFKGILNASLIIKDGKNIICLDFEVLDYLITDQNTKDDSRNVRCFKNQLIEGFCSIDTELDEESTYDVKDLFYLISLNYSLYGLNDIKLGNWIKHIFHKNDMYETPIVINPYRENGKIDVNTEDEQNSARAISNLSQRSDDFSETILSPDYLFDQLNVLYSRNNRKQVRLTKELKEYIEKNLRVTMDAPMKLDNIHFRTVYSPYDFFKDSSSKEEEKGPFDTHVIDFLLDIPFLPDTLNVVQFASVLMDSSSEAFQTIHEYFYHIGTTDGLDDILKNLSVPDAKYIIEDLFAYFICKLFKIGLNYPKEFGGLINDDRTGFSLGREFEECVVKAITSNSHACFKLKRTYFFINFSKAKDSVNFVLKTQENDSVVWKIEKLRYNRPKSLDYRNILKLGAARPEHFDEKFYQIDDHYFQKNDLSWRIPPSIFEIDCLVKQEADGPRFNINQLSSGETQFIYTLQTVLYHIINLNSNEHYKNVIVLLDEIELYHHPEYQRVFISTLIKQINQLKLPNIVSVQLILLTHSPFILSDIPASNVLHLDQGDPKNKDNQTFASNIYDLLKDDFFLEKGVIGDFAKESIRGILDNEDADPNRSKQIIDMIGDPLLKRVVNEKFLKKTKKVELLEGEIKELQEQLKRLKK